MASKARFGWVSNAKRPTKLHRDKSCIEGRTNPRTGKRSVAVPATKEQQERLPHCSFCMG